MVTAKSACTGTQGPEILLASGCPINEVRYYWGGGGGGGGGVFLRTYQQYQVMFSPEHVLTVTTL